MKTIQSTCRGFSLIEVLISMLILAFGVLSMGGLQLASLRSAQMSSKASTAATLAKDYSELMRSNLSVSSVVTSTAGVNPYLFDSSLTSTFTATPSVYCNVGTACTNAQMATFHVADWVGRMSSQLPSGRAVVCRDSAPKDSNGNYKWTCDNTGSLVTIKLGWIDKRDANERGTTSFTITAPQLVLIGMTGISE